MTTTGTVRFSGGKFVVETEPHIRARLKRVFPKAPQYAANRISISDSPENARDLEWFLQRFPMEVGEEALYHLSFQARQHRDMEDQIAELMARRVDLPPFDLAFPPREYQRFAAQMLEIRGGLLLADDVGLGKTVTSICSMAIPTNLPALVVCPTHLPQQWAREITRFAPHLTVHIVKKGTPYPIVRARRGDQMRLALGEDRSPDVLVINYHKLKGWAETLAGHMRTVVFDEVQQLRSSTSEIYRASEHVAQRAHRRLGLSATPIYNYGSEFYSVVNALLPMVLGTEDEFQREWCSGMRLKDSEQFGGYLRREGIMLRRTRSDVNRELPELTKVVHTVDADAKALDALKGNAVALAKTVLAHNERYRGEKMQAAGEFDALMRQATGIAKAPYVATFVKLLMESEERVVLFGWHREVYNMWMQELAEFKPVLYTGSESPAQKAASFDAFAKGDSRVLMMSLRSGAGVDGLQGVCRTVVFGELDWSPGVHEQCVGRVHRDGQDEPCLAYYLVAEDGADPIIVEVLGVKREQIEGVRNPDGALAERVDTGTNSIKQLAREFLRRCGELEETGREELAGASA